MGTGIDILNEVDTILDDLIYRLEVEIDLNEEYENYLVELSTRCDALRGARRIIRLAHEL